jgi:oligopeptide/dipeptide ABC transporter ATP-binding protein
MDLLSTEELVVRYADAAGRHPFNAVDGVSLGVGEGETVGIVGESGCGKSSLANAVVGLTPCAAGRILWRGRALAASGARPQAFRESIQMVFQDPFGSLNPRLSIGACLAEVERLHAGRGEARAPVGVRVGELLSSVGLRPELADRYPHALSGGQRQRIGLARALAVEPELIIADEPVSALDVSVQVQILNLMRRLQAERSIGYILIAHDLAVVRYMCERVFVMYLGRMVELGATGELFARPAHPYTEALLSAVPDVDRGLAGRRGKSSRIVLRGDVPSASARIPGCPFHPRCHRARELCRRADPPPQAVGPGRVSRCHFAAEMAGGGHPLAPKGLRRN